MILDSSAVIAILTQEKGWEALLSKLENAPHLGIGAPTLVETGIVFSRWGPRYRDHLELFLNALGIQILSFGEAHFREALMAFERFGKGRHPASLNFGDCLSYAFAKVQQEPLLCVGDDFPRTDIPIA